ncbi:MAG: GntR family transcriptional regulator, partial [Aquabacterium sp.]
MNAPLRVPPRRDRSLAEGLVDAIEAGLREGRVKSGTRLPTEGQLMAEHGVSRTVVREALSR